MPTKTERIQEGIYCAHWLEHVKIDEVFHAGDGIDQLAQEDGIEHFVLFIDGTHTKTLPFDLRMLTKTTDERYIAILVLNAPYAGEVMGRMFNKFSPVQVEFFRDRDTLMERAYELLAT
ncbi:MAG: hypothetical protein AAFQ07_12275, partial [Chloroflexota bacterium]